MGFSVLIISYQRTSHGFLVYEIRLAREIFKRCKWFCKLMQLAAWLHNLNSQAQAHTPTHPGSVGVLWKSVAYLLCALWSCKQDHVKNQPECFLWVSINQTSELLGKEIKPVYSQRHPRQRARDCGSHFQYSVRDRCNN